MTPTEKLLVELLRRSYQAVDGLWFTMVEQAHDFDHALELDRRVWEILAKIQARKARELLASSGNTPEELASCFGLKLTADGHKFDVSVNPHEVLFTIRHCPWLALLRKSNRDHLALKVAQTICPTEGRVWCSEFGALYSFQMPLMACSGAELCEMHFIRRERD